MTAASPPLSSDGQLYVFGYGSLIWRPGFAHDQAHPALLRGFHRRFCLWSRLYRGTPEAPGLVLGLDRGGACRGVAFRVPAAQARAVLAYLEERENPAGETVYHRRVLPVRLLDSGRCVTAITYVANRAHQAYCRPPRRGGRPRDCAGGRNDGAEPGLPAEYRGPSEGVGGQGFRPGPDCGPAA